MLSFGHKTGVCPFSIQDVRRSHLPERRQRRATSDLNCGVGNQADAKRGGASQTNIMRPDARSIAWLLAGVHRRQRWTAATQLHAALDAAASAAAITLWPPLPRPAGRPPPLACGCHAAAAGLSMQRWCAAMRTPAASAPQPQRALRTAAERQNSAPDQPPPGALSRQPPRHVVYRGRCATGALLFVPPAVRPRRIQLAAWQPCQLPCAPRADMAPL